jgi:hypothetical protein
MVQSENVHYAEFCPAGSLRNDAYLNGLLIMHQKDFLFIRLSDGIAHVRGGGAAQDADALEKLGAKVYRRPMPALRASEWSSPSSVARSAKRRGSNNRGMRTRG